MSLLDQAGELLEDQAGGYLLDQARSPEVIVGPGLQTLLVGVEPAPGTRSAPTDSVTGPTTVFLTGDWGSATTVTLWAEIGGRWSTIAELTPTDPPVTLRLAAGPHRLAASIDANDADTNLAIRFAHGP